MQKALDKLIEKILKKLDKNFTGQVIVTYFVNQGEMVHRKVGIDKEVKGQ